ncbi:MAG: ABC transporter permease/substrate-binding protein [Flavipsychrobacter sp.]|nr:ABC transporter permease/substrate-binding protein [Flavipsychrobacter sp.]
MPEAQSIWSFAVQQSDKLLEQTLTHIGLTFISLFFSILIGLPLGIFIARKNSFSSFVLGFANVLQTIPSIALLGFMIPLLGIGAVPAIVALFLYALLPIIRNTYTGIMEVDSAIKEAAIGMGMSYSQLLFKIEIPLAIPVILAGIRTATVINVGVATLAAYIGAGGLGEFIFGGIALNNTNMLLAGAIPAALLAIVFDFILSKVQHLNFRKWKLSMVVFPAIILILSSFYLIPQETASKLLAGFTPEFMGRTDGYLGLKNKYHLKMRTVVVSDAVMYKAAYEKKIDVISGYSTDGRLKAYGLVTLVDDKGIFPPYYAAPVVRMDVLAQYPELESVLNMLAGTITDSVMTELNYRADYLKESPEKIAKDFLIANNLWREPQTIGQGRVRIGSKIFTEQYILGQMYAMLIRGYTHLDVVNKNGLGGTKICFEAIQNNQIDMYPEYTGTGLLVILQTREDTVEKLSGNKDRVYDFVANGFKEKYNLKWLKPIGFNNAYALMMRRQQSDILHVRTITDLRNKLEE